MSLKLPGICPLGNLRWRWEFHTCQEPKLSMKVSRKVQQFSTRMAFGAPLPEMGQLIISFPFSLLIIYTWIFTTLKMDIYLLLFKYSDVESDKRNFSSVKEKTWEMKLKWKTECWTFFYFLFRFGILWCSECSSFFHFKHIHLKHIHQESSKCPTHFIIPPINPSIYVFICWAQIYWRAFMCHTQAYPQWVLLWTSWLDSWPQGTRSKALFLLPVILWGSSSFI